MLSNSHVGVESVSTFSNRHILHFVVELMIGWRVKPPVMWALFASSGDIDRARWRVGHLGLFGPWSELLSLSGVVCP